MIEISQMFFYFFVVMVLGISSIVAFSRNLLHSAFALFFVLFGMSGFYVLLGADFLAVVQIMVYAGGISVLMIFGTMLTADISTPKISNLSFQGVLGVLSGAAIFGALVFVFYKAENVWNLKEVGAMKETTNSLGKLLLKEYVLPFEVVSFLLLAAMVGALVLVIKGDQE